MGATAKQGHDQPPLCLTIHAGSGTLCAREAHGLDLEHDSGAVRWKGAPCGTKYPRFRLECTKTKHAENESHLDPVWGIWDTGHDDRPILHDFPSPRGHDLGPGDHLWRAYTWQFGMVPSLVANIPGLGGPKDLHNADTIDPSPGLERELVRALLTTALTRLDEPGPAT